MIPALQAVDAQFPWFVPLWVGLFGACVGNPNASFCIFD